MATEPAHMPLPTKPRSIPRENGYYNVRFPAMKRREIRVKPRREERPEHIITVMCNGVCPPIILLFNQALHVVP